MGTCLAKQISDMSNRKQQRMPPNQTIQQNESNNRRMKLDDLAKQLEANEIDRYLKSNLAKFNYQPENVLSSPNKQKLSSNVTSKSPACAEFFESPDQFLLEIKSQEVSPNNDFIQEKVQEFDIKTPLQYRPNSGRHVTNQSISSVPDSDQYQQKNTSFDHGGSIKAAIKNVSLNTHVIQLESNQSNNPKNSTQFLHSNKSSYEPQILSVNSEWEQEYDQILLDDQEVEDILECSSDTLRPTRLQLLKNPLANNLEDYIMSKELGCGSTSVVVQMTHKQESDRIVVKSIKLSRIAHKSVRKLTRQVRRSSGIVHPNLVLQISAQATSRELQIVQPFLDDYYSLEFLNEHVVFSEQPLQHFVKQLVTGLQKIHEEKITHGNLCLSNIFIDKNVKHLKMSDYGNQKQISEEYGVLLNKTKPVIRKFITKRLATMKQGQSGIDMPFLDRRIFDYFCLGCCIVEMVSKQEAAKTFEEIVQFVSEQQSEVFQNIEWQSQSQQLKEFLIAIFSVLQNKTVTIEGLSKLEYLQDPKPQSQQQGFRWPKFSALKEFSSTSSIAEISKIDLSLIDIDLNLVVQQKQIIEKPQARISSSGYNSIIDDNGDNIAKSQDIGYSADGSKKNALSVLNPSISCKRKSSSKLLVHFDIDAESLNESIDLDVDENSKFNPTVLKIYRQ